MKILLIGGTGVLSSAITRESLKSGFDVTMINRGRRTLIEGVSLIKADCRNYSYIEDKLQGRFFDAVIDFLCYSKQDAENSFQLYSKFTKQYFFISSCAVYDKTVPGLKNEESPKGLKIWDYSTEKWACEQRVMELASETGCHYTIVRPCVTYDNTRIPYGIMPPYGYHWTLCARILAGKPVIRWNGGTTRSNMMRVEDFSVGVVGLIGNELAYNESINICGDETPSFNDVLEEIQNVLQKPVIFFDMTSDDYAKELPSRAGEILGGRSIDSLNSNEKIKKINPCFKQNIFLKEGVRQTILAYKNQKFQKGIDWSFDGECDRIISKYCKNSSKIGVSYNCLFTDYLSNASMKDKLRYFLEKNREKLLIRVYAKIRKFFGKMKRCL